MIPKKITRMQVLNYLFNYLIDCIYYTKSSLNRIKNTRIIRKQNLVNNLEFKKYSQALDSLLTLPFHNLADNTTIAF